MRPLQTLPLIFVLAACQPPESDAPDTKPAAAPEVTATPEAPAPDETTVAPADVKSSVVRINSTQQSWNIWQPWEKTPPRRRRATDRATTGDRRRGGRRARRAAFGVASPRCHPGPVRHRSPDPRSALDLSSDPAFRGDATRLNPEQLVVAAASSCQLLSFLAVAARARLNVVSYTDAATAVMAASDRPRSITRIHTS